MCRLRLTSLQTTVSDLIQISPEDFSKYSAVAIEDNINEKYANKVWHQWIIFHLDVLWLIYTKVIQKIGLCIGFYDLLESSDGLIGHGTGLVNVNGMSVAVFYNPRPRLSNYVNSQVPIDCVSAIQGRNHAWEDLQCY